MKSPTLHAMDDQLADQIRRRASEMSISMNELAKRLLAEIFGTIKHRLNTAGTPIPINDVWIASHATEAGAFLITHDEHFDAVPGILRWK